MSFWMNKQESKHGVGCAGLVGEAIFAGYGRTACFKMLRLTLYTDRVESQNTK
jgi:hypothetical protein